MQEKIAKIVLDYPVQLADRLLTEISMRRMTVGDAVEYPITSEKDMLGEVRLMAELCSLNFEDLKALDIQDYEKIQKQLVFFRSPSKSDSHFKKASDFASENN